MLIGPDFHPFYDSDKGQDLGVKTWPPQAWMIGGGTVWGWIAYDPDLNLIYYGTANPGPWNQEQRPGDNKWTAGVFARDPDTGTAKWFYQIFPHDEHDYDGVNEIILLDMPVDGKMRKALIHPDRNGYLYVIDRTTGEVLSADPYGPVNSTKGIDLKTGRPILNPEKVTKLGQTVRDICPTASGTKDWEPSAFSPHTGLDLHPARQSLHGLGKRAGQLHRGHALCRRQCRDEGRPRRQSRRADRLGPGTAQGRAGKIKEDLPVWSGALVTAGDLVFYGTMEGWFKAVDARTGELKWQFKTGSGIIGQPVAYRGPDGREYVAILSGVGGWAGAIVAGNLDPKDPTAALGFVGAIPDLKQKTTPGGTLYVFALPPS